MPTLGPTKACSEEISGKKPKMTKCFWSLWLEQVVKKNFFFLIRKSDQSCRKDIDSF